MRRRVAAASLLLAALTIPPRSSASPCCAGATLMPGRLMIHEEALLGLDLRVGNELGAFGDEGSFAAASGTELAFEQGLFGTLRLARRGQVALRIPLLQTYRSFGGISELGGGLGDLQLQGRWDLVDAGQYLRLPGIALVAGAVLPTGRAPEELQKPLGTDVTGVGALQLRAGLQLEQVFAGSLYLGLMGSAGARAPRTVRGEEVPGSSLFSVSGSIGLLGVRDGVVALNATLLAEPDARRRALQLGVSGGHPIDDEWRIQGGVFIEPPLEGMGRNQPSSLGASLVLLRSWT